MNFIDKLKVKAVNKAIQNSNLSDAEKLDLYQQAFDRMAQKVREDSTVDPRKREEVLRMVEKELEEIEAKRRNL